MKSFLRCCAVGVALVGVGACSSNAGIGTKTGSDVVTQTPASTAGDAQAAAASSAPAAPQSPAAPARQDIQITGQGFTQMPADSIGNSYVSYAVTLTNPNDPSVADPQIASQVNLNITFTDATGTVVGSQSDTVDYILPGQTVADAGEIQVKGAAKIEVKALVDSWQSNGQPITGTLTTSGVRSTSDGYGITTVGTVKSTFAKDYKQLHADAVYYNTAGQIIGGADDWLDFVPANGTASFSIAGLEDIKGIAKSQVYVSFSNLSLADG